MGHPDEHRNLNLAHVEVKTDRSMAYGVLQTHMDMHGFLDFGAALLRAAGRQSCTQMVSPRLLG